LSRCTGIRRRGQHHHDLLAQQLDDLESLLIQRAAQERHVECAGPKGGHGLDGVLAVQDHAQVRQLRRHQRAQRRQDADIGRRKGPDREIAGAASRGLLRQPAGMLDPAENVFGLAQEDTPGVGQRHVMAAALEQGDPDRRLELADLLAERRLGGVEPRGGAGEAQFVGHRHEVPQVPQFHRHKATARGGESQAGWRAVSRETSYTAGPESMAPYRPPFAMNSCRSLR
jgi:hypothetical protein